MWMYIVASSNATQKELNVYDRQEKGSCIPDKYIIHFTKKRLIWKIEFYFLKSNVQFIVLVRH